MKGQDMPVGAPSPGGELSQPLRFERLGIDRIPEEERTSTPWTFSILFLGGSFGLGAIVFGWIPITLGLGLRDAITSMVAGTLVGLIPIPPLVVIGSRT